MFWKVAGILCAFAAAGAAGANATTGSLGTAEPFMNNQAVQARTFGETLPPVGYVDFCNRKPQECMGHVNRVGKTISMTPERWRELNAVNDYVNTTILPATDMEIHNVPEYWTYPEVYGDCEDYALLKRRYLIELGWPSEALLMTVVLDENKEGHAVLMARTVEGDFILDNQIRSVKLWNRTPYHYLKRQSRHDPNVWVSLDPQAPRQSIPVAGPVR